jgi:hypothetical protein
MVGTLFDTDILIDHLNAIPQARKEISASRTGPSASSPGWR